MIPPSKIMIKIAGSFVMLFIMIVFADAGYTAIVLGNQLVHASFVSATLTVLAYVVPIVLAFIALISIWTRKIKK